MLSVIVRGKPPTNTSDPLARFSEYIHHETIQLRTFHLILLRIHRFEIAKITCLVRRKLGPIVYSPTKRKRTEKPELISNSKGSIMQNIREKNTIWNLVRVPSPLKKEENDNLEGKLKEMLPIDLTANRKGANLPGKGSLCFELSI